MTQSGQTDRVFVGRRPEMAVLTAALNDALAGRGQMVMLAGEPGIGKTRLAQELASRAESLGAQVLWGWCYEREGAPPYWPWVQPVRDYIKAVGPEQLRSQMGPGAADIAEVIPEVRRIISDLDPSPALEPEQARFRLFDSIATFFKAASQTQPLTLVLDDLHWADESSLLLLEFLTREIAASPLLILGAYRDVEVTGRHRLSNTLGNLVRESHFQRLRLGGLTRQEVGEFVEASAGFAVADAAVDTLHQRTGGNPLFVGEVVGSVGPEDMARDQDWISRIPEAVREAILRRVSRLSETCNQMLRTASVIGRDFDLPLLRALSPEIAEAEFLEGLDEALGVRIVESLSDGSGRYRFGHALIQQAVYEEIPPMRRAQAHGAAGETLEQLHQNNLDEHAGELAYHFAEATPVGGAEKMVRYSLIAGERALESFAYEQALVHFGRVLAAKEGRPVDADMAAALFGLGRAQAATLPRKELGEVPINLSRAFDYYASVSDTARIVAIGEFRLPTLGEHGVPTGRLAERALELVPKDSLEAGRLHAWHGYVQGMADGDYLSARDSFDRTLAIARRERNAALEMRTLNLIAPVELWHLHLEDSLKSSLIAIDLAVSASDPRGEVAARYWASLSSSASGNMQELSRQASAILEPAERLRDRYWLASAYSTVAFPLMRQGDWQPAKDAIRRGLDLMPLDPRLLLLQIITETQTGNLREVEVHLERLEEVVLQSEAGPNTANAFLAFATPLARSIFGAVKKPELGETAITAVLSSPSATPLFLMFARVGASLLAVMNADTKAAGEQYTALAPSAGIAASGANVDRILGLLAGIMENRDLAAAHFEDALVFCRKSGYRPELAWTCHDYAATLLGRYGPGDREKAASLLEEGLSIATELGMAPLMDKAAALLEEMSSKPVASPAYPDGLTQREVEVLRLVATGKTDREIAGELFISTATVSTHVRNLLNKTGVANRTEATAYAARQGLI